MLKFLSKLKNKKIYLLIILGLLAVGTVAAGTYGYYVHKNQSEGYIKASSFYFDSDYLMEGGKEYTLSINTTSITFELRNFEDSLRCSETDIVYSIELTNGSSGTGQLSITGGTLTGDVRDSVEVTLSGLRNGEEYTVTATASNGYTKTLSATFKVRDVEEGFYKKVSESAPYVILTVWTENVAGEVTIKFLSGLIPDNTCSGMEGVKTSDGQFTFASEEYSSYEFRFFKSSDFIYDSSSFEVLLSFNGANIEAIAK